jgi:hypothetical protein
MVISVAARALLTGQDALAASAVLTNVASSTPSELPRTVRWIEGMRKPPAGSGAKPTSARISSDVLLPPASESRAENCIARQEEWAAAISSSGW